MEYIGLFDQPPLKPVLLSVLQTFLLFSFILLSLRLIGRRVFGEQSPQDLIILILIAEACNMGLSDQQAGFWGAAASVTTILFLGWLTEKIPWLRRLIESGPVVLFKNGRLHRKALEENMVDVMELDAVARRYGLESYHDFSLIVLEGDGQISGTVRKKRGAPKPP